MSSKIFCYFEATVGLINTVLLFFYPDVFAKSWGSGIVVTPDLRFVMSWWGAALFAVAGLCLRAALTKNEAERKSFVRWMSLLLLPSIYLGYTMRHETVAPLTFNTVAFLFGIASSF